MIELNLASKPGIYEDDKPFSNYLVEKYYKQQEVTETSSEGDSTPKIDLDMFDKAEQALDFLEQAEEEEFIPKHTSVAAAKRKKKREKKEKKEKAETAKKKRSLWPVLIFVFAIIAIASFYAIYEYYLTNGEVSTLIQEVVPEEEVEVVEEQPAAEIVTTQESAYQEEYAAEPEYVVEQPQTDQISASAIDRIVNGIGIVETATFLISNIPASSHLQYLRVKSGKSSFIYYSSTSEEGSQIKNMLSGNARFNTPDVFYVERDNTFPNYSYQTMSILSNRLISQRGNRIFAFREDSEVATLLTQVAESYNISVTPLRISESGGSGGRRSQFTGKANLSSCIEFLKKLSDLNINLSVESIYIIDNSSRDLRSTTLEFTVDTILFPHKPQI